MPATIRYDYSTRQYRATCACADCGVEAVHQYVGYPDAENDNVRFDEADQLFRWHSANGRYLNRCRECERAHVRRWRANRSAPAALVAQAESLGYNRRFGVELELLFPSGTSRGQIHDALHDAGLGAWAVKGDGSLNGPGLAVEIASPVLVGEDGFGQIAAACDVIATLGGKPNRTCGLHVHHEMRDLDLDSVKRLATNWSKAQKGIDGFLAPSRRANRGYCRRLRSNEVARINQATSISQACRMQESRYRAINFHAFARYGTVEIRQHQGTADAWKIIAWVKFGQAFIEMSRVSVFTTAVSQPARLLAKLGDFIDTTTKTYLTRRAEVLASAELVTA